MAVGDQDNSTPADTTKPTPPRRWRWARFLLKLVEPFLGLLLVLLTFAYVTGDLEKIVDAQANGKFFLANPKQAGDVPWLYVDADLLFLTKDNFKQVAVQSSIVGLCGIGMTLIIIGGGIDLSIGSVVGLTVVAVALVFQGQFPQRLESTVFAGQAQYGWLALTAALLFIAGLFYQRGRGTLSAPTRAGRSVLLSVVLGVLTYFSFTMSGPIAAVAAGVLIGFFCGFFNGGIITTTRVVPFIVTLGSMELFRGLAQLLAKNQTVPITNLAQATNDYPWLFELMSHPNSSWISHLPIGWKYWLEFIDLAHGVYVTLGTAVLAAILLRTTRLGRYIVAVGSNEQAAKLSGIDVPGVKLWIYSLSGLTLGLAGVLNFAQLRTGAPTAGTLLELNAIAAVVIGGGSLRGGEGSILGTLVGALIMGFLQNGCLIADIPSSVQKIVIGSIIIAAVALDELRYRRSR